jgi:hypothetical protein
MTIDSTWLSAFKEDLPHAFTPKKSAPVPAVFVDGQIRLMQAPQAAPQTWDEFIYRQFTRHLADYFAQSKVVILAFDNYEHVPRAKCMTQAKRRKNIPAMPFAPHAELPCMVPDGVLWTQCMANRTFKTRVIDLVLLRIPMLVLKDRPERRLIVDYQQPAEYRFDPSSGMVRSELIPELPAMGEADLKFTRYASRFGGLLVDSIDGDSIPIALMHHEMCLRRATPPPLVFVYRLELNREPTLAPSTLKRKANEKEGEQKRKKAPSVKFRTYEYVNIHALYEGLKDVISQSVGRITLPSHAGHEMAMLISLIALTGTDFSRNLPQMSGRSVYSWLPDVWPTLAMAYDPAQGCLRVEAATKHLVGTLYRIKFQRHVTSSELQGVLAQLQEAAIAPRTKESLPSYERITCTVRNANWVLAYWTCEPAPDPIQHAYGFRLLPGGCPEYDDGAAP